MWFDPAGTLVTGCGQPICQRLGEFASQTDSPEFFLHSVYALTKKNTQPRNDRFVWMLAGSKRLMEHHF